MECKKIMIIGKPGSGKSTVAKKLSELLFLPVYHIDQYYFNPDWSKQDFEIFMQKQREIVNSDEWIIEGCSTKTFEVRWQKADLVLFLNYPNVVCLWRLIKRRFFSDGTVYSRPEGAKNSLPLHLIMYMLNFERNNKDAIYALHKKYKQIPLYEITNDDALKTLIASLSKN